MSEFIETKSVVNAIFGNNIQLLSSVKELFELEMAYLEYHSLDHQEILNRTAYIKSIDDQLSNHYLLYSEISEEMMINRSTQTIAYFEEGQFSTGYATHGLFPYRGKFHPQLIKGLINILHLNVGDTILDPMSGSGTTNIEAALMGINSIATDVSPFCQFMIQAKYDALAINLDLLENIPSKINEFFLFFKKGDVLKRISAINDFQKIKIYNLAFLAYLDALGYSKRVKTSNHEQLFNRVLIRYYETVKNFLNNPYYDSSKIGDVRILNDSDSKETHLGTESIDCIITSPPYSFAIDYIENDRDQLEFLGYNPNELKPKLIGLRGKTKDEKLSNYFEDMGKVCAEMSRVLKKGKYFVMIIGSNTNQTGGIRLEETIINAAKQYDLILIKSILKPIKGMRNIMKDEYILIFKKGA